MKDSAQVSQKHIVEIYLVTNMNAFPELQSVTICNCVMHSHLGVNGKCQEFEGL